MRILLTTIFCSLISFPALAEIDFDELKGQVVYVDFWASWCGPCKASFPWMNKMHRVYHDKGLTIIAINLDQEPELARNFIAEMDPEFRIEFDPSGKLAEEFKVDTMPTSFLIDRSGKARFKHKGFHDEKGREYQNEIQVLLKESL
ncbi:MAG: TlpA disulfide reductase family protein [Thalassolituus sp.]|uniref:TlpA disulfide reductase family protein n=1 Tax=Thalassolituus sp. TaxID=2030822 RepID=UPI0039825532